MTAIASASVSLAPAFSPTRQPFLNTDVGERYDPSVCELPLKTAPVVSLAITSRVLPAPTG